MPKLIGITGLDGVGKSTLVTLLSNQFPGAAISNIWDIMEGGVDTLLFNSKKDIDQYLCELTHDSRLLFLAHALKFSIDKALASGRELVILNGYYYKYFATELALGASLDLVESIQKEFPIPDQVIHLTLSIDEIAKRKPFFSRYETGLASNPTTSEFIDFQEKVVEKWKNYDQTNWISISAQNTPEELLVLLLEKLKLQ